MNMFYYTKTFGITSNICNDSIGIFSRLSSRNSVIMILNDYCSNTITSKSIQVHSEVNLLHIYTEFHNNKYDCGITLITHILDNEVPQVANILLG